MVKKLLWVILVSALISGLIFTSCSPSAPSQTPTQVPPATSKSVPASSTPAPTSTPTASAKTEKIPVLLSGPPVSYGSYPAIVGIADFLNRKTRLELTVRSQAGTAAMIEAVSKKVASISPGLNSDTVASAYFGAGDYQGKPDPALRAVINIGITRQTWVTTPNTGIKTVPDLKGKKIAWFTATNNAWVKPMLEAYGLDPEKDPKYIPTQNSTTALTELEAGRLDAVHSTLTGAKILSLRESTGNVIVLPLEPQKYTQAKTKYPEIFLGKTQGYLTPGDSDDVVVTGTVPVMTTEVVVITRDDVAEEIIYTFVKTLLDNYKDIQQIAPTLKLFGPETIVSMPNIPYHAGAVKAFQEKGIWKPDMDKAQQALLKK